MELSWTRLGVPHGTAHWLAAMDVGGPTAIRSRWALRAWAQDQAAGFCSTPSLDGPAPGSSISPSGPWPSTGMTHARLRRAAPTPRQAPLGPPT